MLRHASSWSPVGLYFPFLVLFSFLLVLLTSLPGAEVVPVQVQFIILRYLCDVSLELTAGNNLNPP